MSDSEIELVKETVWDTFFAKPVFCAGVVLLTIAIVKIPVPFF